MIYVLFGRDFAKRLIPVDNNSDGVHVFGYIGAPDNIRANRNFQNFFINHRFIKSKTVSAALEQAYSAFIPSDKFPCAILNIDINPALVDVNVHPAKLEVKFSNEKLVFESVYSTVRQALESKIERPEFNINPRGERLSATDYMKRLNSFIPISDGKREPPEQLELAFKPQAQEIKRVDVVPEPVKAQTEQIENKHENIEQITATEFERIDYPTSDLNKNEVASVVSETDDKPAPFDSPFEIEKPTKSAPKPVVTEPEPEEEEPALAVPEYRIIGEAFYSYVFVETGESVLIIDKHAAHERIIFEQLKNNLKKKKIISQMLLVPIDIVLTDAEAVAIGEYAKELKQTGFEFEVYGNTVSITETPTEIDVEGVAPMIQTIAGRLSDGTGTVTVSRDIIYEKALFQASCKAAVKIGHVHDAEHLKWICDRVLALDIIKFCPHGRPVAFELTKHDFERQFKRV